MKTKDFLRKHKACSSGAKWALSISDDMADVWDAMIKDGKYAWLIWTLSRPGVFPSSTLRKLACRFVRSTPLMDGLVVWDLLANERRKAVEVTEAYADGKATDAELRAARVSAAAAYPASRAASRAAYAADAAYATADAAAAAAYAAYAASRAAYAADAAYAAADAADAVAYAAAYAGDAAYAADADAYSAADSAGYAAAKSAQVRMIAELGNPFRIEEKCDNNVWFSHLKERTY